MSHTGPVSATLPCPHSLPALYTGPPSILCVLTDTPFPIHSSTSFLVPGPKEEQEKERRGSSFPLLTLLVTIPLLVPSYHTKSVGFPVISAHSTSLTKLTPSAGFSNPNSLPEWNSVMESAFPDNTWGLLQASGHYNYLSPVITDSRNYWDLCKTALPWQRTEPSGPHFRSGYYTAVERQLTIKESATMQDKGTSSPHHRKN